MSFEWNLSSDEEGLLEFTSKKKLLQHRTSEKLALSVNDGDENGKASSLANPVSISAKLPAHNHDNSDASSGSASSDRESVIDLEDFPQADDDSVCWEDAEAGDENELERDNMEPQGQEVSVSIRPATRNKYKKEESGKEGTNDSRKPPRKQRRKLFRVETLPKKLQSLLHNLHRSHVLAMTCHAVHISGSCVHHPELQAVAHSLLPRRWIVANTFVRVMNYSVPSWAELNAFLEWFFDLVHGAEKRLKRRQRKRRVNASNNASILLKQQRPNTRSQKRQRNDSDNQELFESVTCAEFTKGDSTEASRLIKYAGYLSESTKEDPQLSHSIDLGWNDQDMCSLLIAITRSLGWRCRFVQAMNPIKLDLDVFHPLLAATFSRIFSLAQCVDDQKGATLRDDRKDFSGKAKKRKAESKTVSDSSSYCSEMTDAPITSNQSVMGWVEILCHLTDKADTKLKKIRHRWVHVDPSQKLVDKPDQVEILLKNAWSGISDVSDGSTRGKKVAQSTPRVALAYAIGVEHIILERGSDFPSDNQISNHEATSYVRLTDVTPRYAESWVAALRLRGVARTKKFVLDEAIRRSWWVKTLNKVNNYFKSELRPIGDTCSTAVARNRRSSRKAIIVDEADENKTNLVDNQQSAVEDEIERHEAQELQKTADNEAIPTRKEAFRTHPLYVISSVMKIIEVLAPDASKRICGVFKGEPVYRRSDVSIAFSSRRWPYEGRKVREEELKTPIKRVKRRKRPESRAFKALESYGVGKHNDGSAEHRENELLLSSQPLDDGMDDLYAVWQTDPWSPPLVGKNEPIPVNEYKNVELVLLNPGLVHIDIKGLAIVARRLGIPYAPCLIGFEGIRFRVPKIRGIVVHSHNEEVLREAGVEFTARAIQKEHDNRRMRVHRRWKKLMNGILTKERIEREYG